MGQTVFDRRKSKTGKPKAKTAVSSDLPKEQERPASESTVPAGFSLEQDKKRPVSQLPEALQQRAQERKQLPEPVLCGQVQTLRGKILWDFGPLIEEYPHHELLIRLLVSGFCPPAASAYPASFSAIVSSVKVFLQFLNAPDAVHNTRVSQIADINLTVCSSYTQYLLQHFKKMKSKRSLYDKVKLVIRGLYQKYSHDPRIGQGFKWPPGPSKGPGTIEGYSPLVYGELIQACQEDITETKRLHRLWEAAATGEKLVPRNDFSLPNIMFYLKQKDGPVRNYTPETAIRMAMDHLAKRSDVDGRKCNAVEAFLLRQSLTLEDAVERFKPVDSWQEEPEKRDWPPKGGWAPADFTYWLHLTLFRQCVPRRRTTLQLVKNEIRKSVKLRNALKTLDITIDQLSEIYEKQGEALAALGRDPCGTHVNQNDPPEKKLDTFKATLATLRQDYPTYPFGMTAEEASAYISQERYLTMTEAEHATLEGNLHSVIAQNKTRSFYGGKIVGRPLIRAAYHFLSSTLYPFILHVQLNTGWNLETILSITVDVDDHVKPDALAPDQYVVIYSTKVKGQSNRPDGAKVMKHRCSRNKPFSTYQLLKYVESVVRRGQGHSDFREDSLWQFLPEAGGFKPEEGEKTFIKVWPLSSTIPWVASRLFIERHEFKHFVMLDKDGKPVLDDNGQMQPPRSVDHMKIRSACETVRELQGIPSAIITTRMGHENEPTTEDHYASDAQSNQVKDLKITPLQEKMLDDMRHFDCRIEQDVTLQDLQSAILDSGAASDLKKERLKAAEKSTGIDTIKIVHLIQPDNQPFIAACEDNQNPTWPGCQDYLRPGQSCFFFNKCVLCKRGVIFSEALPYIVRRLMDLDDMLAEMNQAEWLSSFGEEYDGWQAVLDEWKDQQQVAEARARAERGEVMLPNRMRGAR